MSSLPVAHTFNAYRKKANQLRKGNAGEGTLEMTSQPRAFPWVGQFQLEEERRGEAGISHTQPTTLREATAQTLMQLLPSNASND